MNDKLNEIETALKMALEQASDLAKTDLAHCPAALALQARIGNAAEMLGALKTQAASLPAPKVK